MDGKSNKVALKTLVILWSVIVPISTLLFAGYYVIERSMYIDDLQSQLALQKRDMSFLTALLDKHGSDCKVTVDELERVAHNMHVGLNYEPDQLNGAVGSFKFTSEARCVSMIRRNAN